MKHVPPRHPTYTNEKMTLLDKIKSINCGILELSDAVITKILLFSEKALLKDLMPAP